MTAIVCVDKTGAIGKDNQLLYHIKEDMDFFKKYTMGKTCIMGRKTFESLPGNHILPGRKMVVVTSLPYKIIEKEEYKEFIEDGTLMATNKIGLAENHYKNRDDVVVIGGESIYRTFLPECKFIIMTTVDDKADNPDTWFPNIYEYEMFDRLTVSPTPPYKCWLQGIPTNKDWMYLDEETGLRYFREIWMNEKFIEGADLPFYY